MYGKDLYAILGVSSNATQDEIKSAFYRKAKQFHPDVNKGDATAQRRFVEITNAYEILKDANKRKMYDSMRASGGGYGWQQQQAQTGYSGGGYRQQYEQQYAGGNEWHGGNYSDFKSWYRSRYGDDVFRDFEEILRMLEREFGNTKTQTVNTPFGTFRVAWGGGPLGNIFRGGVPRSMGGLVVNVLAGVAGALLSAFIENAKRAAEQDHADIFRESNAATPGLGESRLPREFRLVADTAVESAGRLVMTAATDEDGGWATVEQVGQAVLELFDARSRLLARAEGNRTDSEGRPMIAVKDAAGRLQGTITEFANPLLRRWRASYLITDAAGRDVLLVKKKHFFSTKLEWVDEQEDFVAVQKRKTNISFAPLGLRDRWETVIEDLYTAKRVHPSFFVFVPAFLSLQRRGGPLRSLLGI